MKSDAIAWRRDNEGLPVPDGRRDRILHSDTGLSPGIGAGLGIYQRLSDKTAGDSGSAVHMSAAIALLPDVSAVSVGNGQHAAADRSGTRRPDIRLRPTRRQRRTASEIGENGKDAVSIADGSGARIAIVYV